MKMQVAFLVSEIQRYKLKGAGTGGAGGARAPPALWPEGPGGTFTKVKVKEKRCLYAKTSALLTSVPPLPLSRSGALVQAFKK